ncbi:MAG: carbon-nitrogen hydrolase family protein [Planctomycetia bacterium]
MVKLAGVQMDVVLGDVSTNRGRILDFLRQTAAVGARLTIFPECALTGYCFEDRDEAVRFAEKIPGPSTAALTTACAELNVYTVVGMLETDGRRLYNAAVLIGPDGVLNHYRKVHLPAMGVDRLTTGGDRPFDVAHAGRVRVGMNICYDISFPEASRCLALEGADLIALPTNWPTNAEANADYMVNARAMENNVYFFAVNRVGDERGFHFIGRSRLCGPNGRTIAEAAHDREEIVYGEIDPEIARAKKIVRVPGKHEIDRMKDRRPELYGPLVESNRFE